MFNVPAYSMVDTIQESKKKFVNTFVTNPEINTVLNSFVDAQAKYTKQAIDAGSLAFTKLASMSVDKKFYTDAMAPVQEAFAKMKDTSSYFPTADCAKPSKKAK